MDKFNDHEAIIKENKECIKRIATSLERIEKDVRPIKELMSDVAAVGRFGRCLGKFVIWLASIVAALGLLWALIVKSPPPPPH
jgi:hypothetical protein